MNSCYALVITIHSPTNTTYNITTIWLNVTANETVDTWYYNLNNIGNVSFTPNITLGKNEGLQQGQNYVTVWANDTAGNWNSSTVYFTINATSNITIYIYQPENITYNTSNQVSLKFEAVVSNSLEDNYHIKAYMDNINIYDNNSYTKGNVSICYFGYSNEQAQQYTCTASCWGVSSYYWYDFNVYDCSSTTYAEIYTHIGTYSGTSGYGEIIKSVIYNMVATPQSEVNIYWQPSGHYYDHDGTSKSIIYIYNYNTSTWDKKVEYSWTGYAPLMSKITTKIQLNESYVRNKIAKIKVEAQDKVYAGLQSYDSEHEIHIYYIKLTATPPLGQNNVTIWINDTDTLNPNVAEQTRYFTMSYLIPTITITSPLNKTYETSSITLTISATDYYKILYSLNGGSNATYTGSTTITAIPGQNNLTAWAINEWGNATSDIVYFSYVVMNINPTSYEYTTYANASNVFNITVSHNANVTRTYNISCWSGSACGNPNFTITFYPSNVTVINSTDTKDFKVNITTKNDTPAGTYDALFRIWMEGEQIWRDFSVTIHIAEFPGIISIVNPADKSFTIYTDDTISFGFIAKNTGTGDLTNCVTALDGDFTSATFVSYSPSSFNLSANENITVTITFTTPPAGVYTTSQGIQITCETANTTTSLNPDDRFQVTLSVLERPAPAPTGGGGGATVVREDLKTPNLINFFVYEGGCDTRNVTFVWTGKSPTFLYFDIPEELQKYLVTPKDGDKILMKLGVNNIKFTVCLPEKVSQAIEFKKEMKFIITARFKTQKIEIPLNIYVREAPTKPAIPNIYLIIATIIIIVVIAYLFIPTE